jgi:hypothetical protein
MNLEEVILDGDLADPYTVMRSNGQFVAGGFTDTKTSFNVWGVVSLASLKDLQMVPEGDRVTEMRVFYSNQPLYVTRSNVNEGTGTSDILVWNGIQYRVVSVLPQSNRNFWKAIAARMAGN